MRFPFGLAAAAVLAGVLTLGTALLVSALFFPITTHVLDPIRGEQVFRTRCASCHSVAADAPPGFGPSLYNVGKWADTRIPGTSAEEYVLSSIVDPAAFRAPGSSGVMPQDIARQMPAEDVLNVTTFLLLQGGEPHHRDLLRLARRYLGQDAGPPEVTRLELAAVERGRALYLDKLNCAQCHPLDGSPGFNLRAPSLLTIGNHRRAFLEESVLHPSKEIAPGYETWQVIWKDSPVSGRRLPGPDGTVRLLTFDTNGDMVVRTFPCSELEPLGDGQFAMQSPVSAMPSYETALDKEELQALIDFLCTLR
jgi:mono/diheme cytochrome c family protein